ncbi:hypothetical protein F4809DRAFT_395175 [Biscogniauxia mediterranea]|nr:hypothetical protein F4809DRAFT_395175 [Biscogniauxia mediterranea]
MPFPHPRPRPPLLSLPRHPHPHPHPHPRPHPRPRHQSTTSSSTSSSSSSSSTTRRARLSRLLSRTSRFLPARLRAPLSRLRSAPLSHVGAFLALHEATAVVPVVGLAWGFHAADWVPPPLPLWEGGWGGAEGEGGGEEGVKKQDEDKDKDKDKGLARWERYFRRKGWFGLGEVVEEAEENKEEEEEGVEGTTAVVVSRENREKGYRIGMQIAAAYAITKMLLVPRIALSLWLTPSLARGFVRFRQAIWRKRS